MNMIDAPSLLTIIYVLVDDWYTQHGNRLVPSLPGPQPVFSDSELLTLVLAMDYFPYPGEQQFLGFIRANYLNLFPKLLDQSQFNRRVRRLEGLLEELRRFWVSEMGATFERTLLLDTKPIPVLGYKRSKRQSDFTRSASYGHCASRKMNYFGYKLVVISTLAGVPLVYSLVPAHTDEREAAEVVLQFVRGCNILADKGFIGTQWQAEVSRTTNNRIFTAKRVNQHQQTPAAFERLLNHFRERIEGVFNEVQNTGRNLERLLRKKVDGLCTHVAAKMASHTLRILLRQQFGIDVLTFEQTPVQSYS
ncbi:IS982 family transposase [Calothrix sp. PCC 6303]|uniref:IS982 family transposase n=1 Tax=Calothrix sp. PCC 6303 TaxID=1170562 RepID=UPI0002A03700|nr:IS982 family transposase [Calothrix sp. PCC 6303]AFZ02281.1 transposase IS4 family protein [Calothrix sp. PCC 6303]